MSISVPENLKFFKTSHWIRGKCNVKLWSETGIVMSQQERTMTRVYGDNRGVGSSVTVDQAMWVKFGDGSENCIDFPNTDTHLSRPGHQITFVVAENQLDRKKFYDLVAFYNHATDIFYFYRNIKGFRSQWRFILYKKPPLGLIGNYLRGGLLTGLGIPLFSGSREKEAIGIGLLAVIIVVLYPLAHITDRRYEQFEKHIENIVKDFRKQLEKS
jgi:hypothetical protein